MQKYSFDNWPVSSLEGVEAEMIWFVCIAYSSRWVNIGIAMKKECGGYFALLKELASIA